MYYSTWCHWTSSKNYVSLDSGFYLVTLPHVKPYYDWPTIDANPVENHSHALSMVAMMLCVMYKEWLKQYTFSLVTIFVTYCMFLVMWQVVDRNGPWPCVIITAGLVVMLIMYRWQRRMTSPWEVTVPTLRTSSPTYTVNWTCKRHASLNTSLLHSVLQNRQSSTSANWWQTWMTCVLSSKFVDFVIWILHIMYLY